MSSSRCWGLCAGRRPGRQRARVARWRASAALAALAVIVRGGRIQLPAVLVALGDLVGALQLLVVVVFDAEGVADFVDAILVRRRVVAARGFVAARVGLFPVRVHVAAGQSRARLGVRLALRLLGLGAALGGGGVLFHPERGGDGGAIRAGSRRFRRLGRLFRGRSLLRGLLGDRRRSRGLLHGLLGDQL